MTPQVDTITRKLRYFYDPATGERLIKISGSGCQSWYVELTLEQYNQLGVLLSDGGYVTAAQVAYMCGLNVPQNDRPEYAIGYCGHCHGGRVQPVRWLNDYPFDYLCREHYERASKSAEVEK